MSSPLSRLDVPFINDLGIDFIDAPPGAGCVALDLQPRHLNSWKVAHGGVIMTMLDVAMAIAGRSLDPEARGGVTVEMKTSFLQPGPAGTRLVATGKAFHRSTTMSFCEGEVRDSDDRLIAKAIGTFKTIKRIDAHGRVKAAGSTTASLPDAGSGGDGG
jgi:acyl-CoA thioesterase